MTASSVAEARASEAVAAAARPASLGRLPAIDAARGIAILAMAVYHSAWDLQFLQLAPVDAVDDPVWRHFAHLIAGSFLFLVGVSLVLASRSGLKLRPYLIRLAMIVAAAAAVTAATYVATPGRFIFFGILHAIAVSSVLALPFLTLPFWVSVATGLVVIALPFLVALPVFDQPLLWWVGLGTRVPNTSDYVPIFPWFGPVLLGVGAAKGFLPRIAARTAPRWQPRTMAGRALTFAGRHSLAIYLLHQPILMGVFWTLLQIAGPSATAQNFAIVRSCEATCHATGGAPDTCRRSCLCSREALKGENLWRPLVEDRLSMEMRARISTLAHQCRTAAGTGP